MEDKFLIGVYIASIGIHILALIVHGTWVIPLQIKEAGVKNGLKKLRVLFLASGITIMMLSIISILVLSARFFVPEGQWARYYYLALILFHSFGFLTFSIIKRIMYKQQYSDKQKELHNKLAQLENSTK